MRTTPYRRALHAGWFALLTGLVGPGCGDDPTGTASVECRVVRTDDQIVCVQPPDESTVLQCGSGTVRTGNVCLPDEGLTCGPGTALNGSQCLPTTQVGCGDGTVEVNGQCVPEDVLVCGGGTEQIGDECVASADSIECGPGTRLEETSRTCLLECPEGAELDRELETCIFDTVECGPGTLLDEETNTCVPECPEGTLPDPETGECVRVPNDCAEGTVLDESSNTCVPDCPDRSAFDPERGICVDTGIAVASGGYRAVPSGAQRPSDMGFVAGGPGLPDCPLPSTGELTFRLAAPDTGGLGSGRQANPRLADGARVVLPAVRRLGASTDAAAEIAVQNTGSTGSFYGVVYLDESGLPIGSDCTGHLSPGQSWRFEGDSSPNRAVSANVYAMGQPGPGADPCRTVADLNTVAELVDFDLAYGPDSVPGFSGAGQRAAVVVTRAADDQDTHARGRSAAHYNGLSDLMIHGDLGRLPYRYVVAEVQRSPPGTDTVLHIRNDGVATAHVELRFNPAEEGVTIVESVTLDAFATRALSVPDEIGPAFVGSVELLSDQPLAVVADVLGALPAVSSLLAERVDLARAVDALVAPITYRAGWEHAVSVHNLSNTSTDATVAFLGATGVRLSESTRRIAAGHSATFTAPAGAVPARSEAGSVWVDATTAVSAVARLSRTDDSGGLQELIAFNLVAESELAPEGDDPSALFFVPSVSRAPARGGTETELLIQNANLRAGVTSWAAWVYDGAGGHEYRCGQIRRGETQRIPVDWAELGAGFRGSLVVAATASTQVGGPALSVAALEVSSPRDPLQEGDPVVAPRADPVSAMTALRGFEEQDGERVFEVGVGPLVLPLVRGADESAHARIDLFNAGEGDAVIGLVFVDGEGRPLPSDVVAETVAGTAAWGVDDEDIPAGTAGALAFSLDPEQLEVLDRLPLRDSAELAAFLLDFESTIGAHTPILGSVTRETGAPVRHSTYAALGDDRLGRPDPVSAGFQYHLLDVHAAINGHDSAVSVLNVGPWRVQPTTSFRRPGLAAEPRHPEAPWHFEGGDVTAQLGALPGGGALSLEPAEHFGGAQLGLLELRATSRLAAVTESDNGAVLVVAIPAASCGERGEACVFSMGAHALYGPLLPDPVAYETSVHLANLAAASTATPALLRMELMDSGGTVVASQEVEVRPFESVEVTLPEDLSLRGRQPGSLLIAEVGEAAERLVELWGVVRIQHTDRTGESLAYELLPIRALDAAIPASSDPPPELGLAVVPGVVRAYGDPPSTTTLTMGHAPDPMGDPVEVQVDFFDDGGLLHTERRVLEPGVVQEMDLDDLPQLPPGYRGTVVVSHPIGGAQLPGVGVVAVHRWE